MSVRRCPHCQKPILNMGEVADRVLHVLRETGPASIKGMRDTLGISTTSLYLAVRELEWTGLITRQRKNDRSFVYAAKEGDPP